MNHSDNWGIERGERVDDNFNSICSYIARHMKNMNAQLRRTAQQEMFGPTASALDRDNARRFWNESGGILHQSTATVAARDYNNINPSNGGAPAIATSAPPGSIERPLGYVPPEQMQTPPAAAPSSASASPLGGQGGQGSGGRGSKVKYWNISLDEKSTFQILNSALFAQELKAPAYQSLIPKDELHCTLLYFDPKQASEREALRIERDVLPKLAALEGREGVEMRIYGGINVPGKLSCCAIEILDPDLKPLCQFEHPHLTLALAPGVQAKESNDVLQEVALGFKSFNWNTGGTRFVVKGTVRRIC